MGLFSNWKKKAETQNKPQPAASAGKMCSVTEALDDLADDIQARKVVDLALDLYGKTKITTTSGANVTIADLKTHLDRMTLDEFAALNVTMSGMVADLKEPSSDMKAAAPDGLIERMLPVAEAVSGKFAEYFLMKKFF